MAVTVTRATSLFTAGDQDETGTRDAGDTLYHVVTIVNPDGEMTNVSFSDTLKGSTLVNGSLNASPVASNDAYNAVGNTLLEVGNATNQSGPQTSYALTSNLLANDYDPLGTGNGATFQITSVTSTQGTYTVSGGSITGLTSQGGTLTVIVSGTDAGSFSYMSAAGYEGIDSFKYTIRDNGSDGIAGTADDLSSEATVSITVSEVVWYVNNSTGAVNGNGTSTNPYNTLTQLNGVTGDGTTLDDLDEADDYIYLMGTAATGGIVLEGGQKLIGTGAALTVGGLSIAATANRSALTASSGTAVTLAGGGAGNYTIAGLDISSDIGAGIVGTSFGTVTVNNATLFASGPALSLTTGAFAGNGFVDTSSSGGTNNVLLSGVTGNIALGTGLLTGASGTNFSVTGGSGNITFDGSINDNSGQLINITGRSSGTIDFNGLITDNFAAADGGGVSITSNTGGAVRFDGGLQLSTTSGVNAFVATGNSNAMTLVITDPAGATANKINAPGGTAVNIASTLIGSGGVTFESVSSSGGTGSGIILDSAGTGGFTITGTGSGATGGTIANKTGTDGQTSTGIGVYINNTSNVSLSYMQLDDLGNYAIRGNNVTNFTLANSVVNGANGTNPSLDEASLSFDNLTGTATISNTSISGGLENNFRLVNSSGILNLTFTTVTIGANSSTDGNDGIGVEMTGNANLTMAVQTSTFTSARGDLFQVSGNGTGTTNLTFNGNTLSNNHPAISTGGGGVSLFNGGDRNSTFTVTNNTFRDAVGHAVLVVNGSDGMAAGATAGGIAAQDGDLTLVFVNNTIGVPGTANSGSREGAGLKIQHAGGSATSILDADIINNNIYQYNNEGILIQAGAGIAATGRIVAEVADNVVSNPGNNAAISNIFQGFNLNSGVTPGDTFVTYLTLGGDGAQENDFRGSGRNGGVDIRIRARQDTDVHVTANDSGGNVPANSAYHYTGGTTDAGALAAFVAQHNANSPTATTQSHVASETGQFRGDSPPAPANLMAEAPPPAPGAGETSPDGENLPEQQDDQPQVDTSEETGGAPAPSPNNAPVVIDDGILSQAELDLIVNAAIERWAAAGATPEQIAAMRAVTITVTDLGGLQLGSSGAGTIQLDDNGAGWSWFIDTTPGEDSEYAGSGTSLSATDPYSMAGTRIDLLTVVMHELGHQIGLTDLYSGDVSELMYGTITAGARRLPGDDDAAAGGTSPVSGGLAIASTLSKIPANSTIQVTWQSTVDAVGTGGLVAGLSGAATVGSVTSSTESLSVDALSIGNLVFHDVNKNGLFDGTDTGIVGVTMTLYLDNGTTAGVFDSGDQYVGYTDNGGGAGYQQGIDTPAAPGTGTALIATSGAGGAYRFDNLAPGDYIVVVGAANFTGGGALVDKSAKPGADDPDSDIDDGDNNAVQYLAGQPGTYSASMAITLSYGDETDAGTTGTALDANFRLDLGFISPNAAPSGTSSAAGIDEDAPRTLAASDFGYGDTDGNSFLEVIVNSVSGGTLTVNGTAVTSFPATVTVVQLNANQVVFTPTGDLNGTGAGSISFQVRDNGGTEGGGVDTDQSANTLTFNIAAVNDPVSTSAPATLTLDEDSVDYAVTGLSISDVDATLAPAGVYVVTLSSTQGTMTLTTQTGLTFSAGDGTADTTMTFRGTLADINTALATAKYTPTGNLTARRRSSSRPVTNSGPAWRPAPAPPPTTATRSRSPSPQAISLRRSTSTTPMGATIRRPPTARMPRLRCSLPMRRWATATTPISKARPSRSRPASSPATF